MGLKNKMIFILPFIVFSASPVFAEIYQITQLECQSGASVNSDEFYPIGHVMAPSEAREFRLDRVAKNAEVVNLQIYMGKPPRAYRSGRPPCPLRDTLFVTLTRFD